MRDLLCVNLIVEVEEANEILSERQVKIAERVLSHCAVDHGCLLYTSDAADE